MCSSIVLCIKLWSSIHIHIKHVVTKRESSFPKESWYVQLQKGKKHSVEEGKEKCTTFSNILDLSRRRVEKKPLGHRNFLLFWEFFFFIITISIFVRIHGEARSLSLSLSLRSLARSLSLSISLSHAPSDNTQVIVYFSFFSLYIFFLFGFLFLPFSLYLYIFFLYFSFLYALHMYVHTFYLFILSVFSPVYLCTLFSLFCKHFFK